MVRKKTANGYKMAWEKLPGHKRNEALDCRNYALAAFKTLDPDMDALAARLEAAAATIQSAAVEQPKKMPRKRPRRKLFDEW